VLGRGRDDQSFSGFSPETKQILVMVNSGIPTMLAKFLDVALTEFARVGNAKYPPPFSVGRDYHRLVFIREKNGPLANEVGFYTGWLCICQQFCVWTK